MWIDAQDWLFEQFIQPLLFTFGGMAYAELAFDSVEWVMIGGVELLLLMVFAATAERWWPVEQGGDSVERRRRISVDQMYAAIHRLGVFPLLLFFTLTPCIDTLESLLRSWNITRPNMESIFPWLADLPLLAFVLYLFILDGVDYWIHRAQHRFTWWWALHALHHSQRSMTVWSDQRNHLLDDWIRDAIIAMIGLMIGIPPGQFIGLVVVNRVLQSVQHANVRWGFGEMGDRLLVSPWFHRLHHGIDIGHSGKQFGCNFAVLFPVWDWVFGTADWQERYQPTGIRDQLTGRDYGEGFWRQQWLGVKRLVGADEPQWPKDAP